MALFASDLDNQTLVTDLVHELSSELEIPSLLNESSVYEKEAHCDGIYMDEEKVNYRCNDTFLVNENDLFVDSGLLFNYNSVKNEDEPLLEAEDLQSYLVKNGDFTSYPKTDSSGHGSGSDSSSTELWTVKSERDASPVSNPEERISPDNIMFFPSNELRFIPISHEGSKKNKLSLSGNRIVRIQPKPNNSNIDNCDNQHFGDKTIVCSVFKDVQSPLVSDTKCVNDVIGNKKNFNMSRKELQILQAKRKQERMIRNRESAYLSRKRKKEYVANLEKQVQELTNDNIKLRQENDSLRKRLMKYENIESFSFRSKGIFSDSPRKATMLFIIMVTICLNMGSFSNFIHEKGRRHIDREFVQNDNVAFHMQNVRHTRSLLWSDSNFDDLKSLANMSKTSCPINQTESIRLESELRRWIGGDEDRVRPLRRNISSHYYPLTSIKGTKSQMKTKRKNRVRKVPTDIDVDIFPMKSHFFNFDTFFEAINRRADTFYLVSFSADHLLLPALAHNKTSRPKMSLMLPAFLSNSTLGVSSDQVEMMQIDCEVTNTQVLSVNENDIPSHMRPYQNSTSKQKNSNSDDTGRFSRFLVNDLINESVRDENVNGTLKKKVKNFLTLKRNATARGVNEIGLHEKPKSFNTSFYKLTKYNTDGGFNESIKEKISKSKTEDTGQKYFFGSKEGSASSSLSDSSNSNTVDGLQFLDSNTKVFLKDLLVPLNLSETKNLNFTKKSYLKHFKSGMKLLLP